MTNSSATETSAGDTSAGDTSAGEAAGRCRWCRRVVIRRPGPGRPKQFCSQKCRQWDWVSRQRSADLALGTHEIVVDRDELDRLQDDVYMLSCAVADVENDLDGRPTNRELRESLDWIIAAAKPLASREISGPSISPAKTS